MNTSKRIWALLALVTGLCLTVRADEDPMLPYIFKKLLSGETNAYCRPLLARAGPELPFELCLVFRAAQDGERLENGEKVTMRIAALSGAQSHDLLRVPVWVPNDVPWSYEVGYDETTRTFVVAFLAYRPGCVVYELEVPREQDLSPAAISSIHADVEPQQKGKIKTTRSVIQFADYEKYVGRKDKVQRLKPLKVTLNKGTILIRVALPPQAGAESSAGTVLFSKPVGDAAAQWKVEGVTTPSVGARVCYQNLGSIRVAKEQWSRAEHKKTGAVVIVQQVDEYIKDGHPVCPGGGEYIYGALGEAPKCTIHGTSE